MSHSSYLDEVTSSKSGMRDYQQARTLLEAAMLVEHIMNEKGISKSDLAKAIAKSKAHVSQILDGTANMTLKTLSDILFALDYSLDLKAKPLTMTASSASPLNSGQTELVDDEIDSVETQRQAIYELPVLLPFVKEQKFEEVISQDDDFNGSPFTLFKAAK